MNRSQFNIGQEIVILSNLSDCEHSEVFKKDFIVRVNEKWARTKRGHQLLSGGKVRDEPLFWKISDEKLEEEFLRRKLLKVLPFSSGTSETIDLVLRFLNLAARLAGERLEVCPECCEVRRRGPYSYLLPCHHKSGQGSTSSRTRHGRLVMDGIMTCRKLLLGARMAAIPGIPK